MSSKSWFVPAAVVLTCLPCILIPVTAALIAAGAFGGLLGFLGVPWVLAIAAAAPVAAVLVILRLRPHGTACSPHVAARAAECARNAQPDSQAKARK